MSRRRPAKGASCDRSRGHQSASPFVRTIHKQPLGPSLPSLEILYTNDPQAISEWLEEHVWKDTSSLSCLGLDTESKPCFTRQAAMQSKGPDVLQLSRATGKCLVIHLSKMMHKQLWKQMIEAKSLEDMHREERLKGFVQIQKVLQDRSIAKAGIGLMGDATELYENHAIDMICRMELTVIEEIERQALSESNHETRDNKSLEQNGDTKDENARPRNLKGIAEYYVPGLILPKKKKLQMSNWAHNLTDEQVAYAASDAFAAAIVVDRVTSSQSSSDSSNSSNRGNISSHEHTMEGLVEHVLKDEKSLAAVLQERQRKKGKRRKKNQERNHHVPKSKHPQSKDRKRNGGKRAASGQKRGNNRPRKRARAVP